MPKKNDQLNLAQRQKVGGKKTQTFEGSTFAAASFSWRAFRSSSRASPSWISSHLNKQQGQKLTKWFWFPVELTNIMEIWEKKFRLSGWIKNKEALLLSHWTFHLKFHSPNKSIFFVICSKTKKSKSSKCSSCLFGKGFSQLFLQFRSLCLAKLKIFAGMQHVLRIVAFLRYQLMAGKSLPSRFDDFRWTRRVRTFRSIFLALPNDPVVLDLALLSLDSSAGTETE